MTNHSHKLTTINTSSSCDEEELEDFTDRPPALVFDADFIGQQVPPEFNAVKISLEGTVDADLVWNEAKKAAEIYTAQGLEIFWDIDLALFDRLKRPLTDQSQFSTLAFSLEHFRDTLWKQFQNQTVGLCIYRGSADFYRNWKWDDEQVVNLQDWIQEAFEQIEAFTAETGVEIQAFENLTVDALQKTAHGQRLLSLFCRDVAAEYVELLAKKLPDSLKCFVLLDGTAVEDLLHQAQLTINERYSGLQVAIKGKQDQWIFPWEDLYETALIGKSTVQEPQPPVSIGVCLPSIACRKPSEYNGLKNMLHRLESCDLPFRVVAENLLTTEWDGLDYLFVTPQSLSPQGLRKLRGFCAAGGTVVSLGKSLGLDREVSVDQFDLLYKISDVPHAEHNR